MKEKKGQEGQNLSTAFTGKQKQPKGQTSQNQISRSKKSQLIVQQSSIQPLIILATLVASSKAINLLTSLPPDLYINIKDKPALHVSNIVNGSQLNSEVFPKPVLQSTDILTPQKFLKEYEDCSKMRNLKDVPHLSVGLCAGPKLQYACNYVSNNQMQITYFDSGDHLLGLDCRDLEYLYDMTFVLCLNRSSSGGHDVVVKAFRPVFNFSGPNGLNSTLDTKGSQEALKLGEGDDFNASLTLLNMVTFPDFFPPKFDTSGYHRLNCAFSRIKDAVCVLYQRRLVQFDEIRLKKAGFAYFNNLTTNRSGYQNVTSQVINFNKQILKIMAMQSNIFFYQYYNDPFINMLNLTQNGTVVSNLKNFTQIGYSDLDRWDLYHRYKGNDLFVKAFEVKIYFLNRTSFRGCTLDKRVPGSNGNLEIISLRHCQEIKIGLDQNFLKKLRLMNFRYDNAFQNVYYAYNGYDQHLYLRDGPLGHKNQNRGTGLIKGYLRISLQTYTSQYYDLSNLQASELYFVVDTKFMIYRDKKLSLWRQMHNVVIFSPEPNQPSQKIYLGVATSTISDPELDSQQFVVSSEVHSLDSTNYFLKSQNLKNLVLYNKGLYLMGYNSKLIIGNGAQLNISLGGHQIPSETQFYSQFNLEALSNISDINIKSLFVREGFYTYNIDSEFSQLTKFYSYLNFMIIFQDVSMTIKIFECNIPSFLSSHANSVINLLYEVTYCKLMFSKRDESRVLDAVERTHNGQLLLRVIETKSSTKDEVVWVRLIQFSNKYEELGDILVSPFKARCDQDYSKGILSTVCAYSLAQTNVKPGSVKYPKNGLIVTQIKMTSTTMHRTDFEIIDLFKFGISKFKVGMVAFSPKSQSSCFFVNNHPESLVLVEINLRKKGEKSTTGLRNMVFIKPELNTGLGPNPQPNDIGLCPMAQTLVVYSMTQSKLYGLNMRSLDQSYLTVPFYNLKKQNRLMTGFYCSGYSEAFQVRVKDQYSGEQYLVNYYGFDGFQGAKKIHSQIPLESTMDSFATGDTFFDGTGVFFTFVYDKSTIFYNASYLINLGGPQMLLDMTNIVPGNYTFDVNISNTKSSINQSLHVVLQEHRELVVAQKTEQDFYTGETPTNATLDSFVAWTGDVSEIKVGESQRGYVKVHNELQTLEDGLQFNYSTFETYCDASDEFVIFENSRTYLLSIYKNFTDLVQQVNLRNFGGICMNFEITQYRDMLVIKFICEEAGKNYVYLLRMDIESYEVTVVIRLTIDFVFYKEVTTINPEGGYVFIGFNEKEGNDVYVFKVPLSSTLLDPDYSEVVFKWRSPGDLSLFSKCEFDMLTVDGIDIVALLSQGESTFRLFVIDFDRKSTANIMTVVDESRLPFYFIECEGKMQKPVYKASRDQSRPDNLKYPPGPDLVDGYAVCFVGGAGIQFYEYRIDINVYDINSIVKPILLNSYLLPQLKQSYINQIDIKGNYFLVRGFYGKYKTGFKRVNETVIDPKTNKTKNVTVIKPFYLKFDAILYKRGVSRFKAVIPIVTYNSELIVSTEDNTTKVFTLYENNTEHSGRLLDIRDKVTITVQDELQFIENERRIDLIFYEIKDIPNNIPFTFRLDDKKKVARIFGIAAAVFILSLVGCVLLWTLRLYIVQNTDRERKARELEEQKKRLWGNAQDAAGVFVEKLVKRVKLSRLKKQKLKESKGTQLTKIEEESREGRGSELKGRLGSQHEDDVGSKDPFEKLSSGSGKRSIRGLPRLSAGEKLKNVVKRLNRMNSSVQGMKSSSPTSEVRRLRRTNSNLSSLKSSEVKGALQMSVLSKKSKNSGTTTKNSIGTKSTKSSLREEIRLEKKKLRHMMKRILRKKKTLEILDGSRLRFTDFTSMQEMGNIKSREPAVAEEEEEEEEDYNEVEQLEEQDVEEDEELLLPEDEEDEDLRRATALINEDDMEEDEYDEHEYPRA